MFHKSVKKPFFSEAEKTKLEAIAAEYTRLRKIQESLHGSKKVIKKNAGSSRQRSRDWHRRSRPQP